MIQRTLALILTLTALVLCLAACRQQKSYLNDRRCEELMDDAVDQIPVTFGYDTFESDHLRYCFDDWEEADDACLRYSIASENINEIGIFHSPTEEKAREIYEDCKEYLNDLREEKSTFIASYAAEELPKLERAEVRRFGNYTVYAILSDDDRTLVFDTIEQALTPKK